MKLFMLLVYLILMACIYAYVAEVLTILWAHSVPYLSGGTIGELRFWHSLLIILGVRALGLGLEFADKEP